MNRFNTHAALLLLSVFFPCLILAAPPYSPYMPGDTLSPNCEPGTPNCTVQMTGSTMSATDNQIVFIENDTLVGMPDFTYDPTTKTLWSTNNLFTNASTTNLSIGNLNGFLRADNGFVTTGVINTGDVLENGNLYFTNARADARVGVVLSGTTSLPQIVSLDNLSNVGTITNGTWNGSVIDDAYISKVGNWVGTFDGHDAAYYLARANQTGTQLANTISDFGVTARSLISSNALALTYSTSTGQLGLQSGYSIPTLASSTEWAAKISSVNGKTASAVILDTGDIIENGNLYFTNARADARVNAILSVATSVPNLSVVGTIASGTWNGALIGDAYISKVGNWVGTFDGQEGSFYLDRVNQTGTQLSNTISDFSSTSRNLFSVNGLGLQYSTSTGQVSLSSGYIIPSLASTSDWSLKISSVNGSTSPNIVLRTSDIVENGNLYFTNVRADARVNLLLSATTSLPQITTLSNLTNVGTITSGTWQGGVIADSYISKVGNWAGNFNGYSGIYYLDRANQTGTQLANTISDFASSSRALFSSLGPIGYNPSTGAFTFSTSSLGLSTNDIAEGANQYFTNLRADNRIALATSTLRNMFSSGVSSLVFSTTTGQLSLGAGFSIPTTASSTYWNNKLDIGNNISLLSNDAGFLTSVNLVSNTTGILSVTKGGLGTSTVPGIGQLFIGNGSGGYTLSATSSLGFRTADIIEDTNLYWTNNRFDTRLGATTTLASLTSLPNLTTVGTISSGVWNGSLISVAKGGTGTTTFGGVNTLLYTTSANTIASLPVVNGAIMVTSGGGAPTWTNTLPAFTLGGHVTANNFDILGLDQITVTGTTSTSTFSTGGLSVGGSQFIIQAGTGRVGLGVTNPSVPLHVKGDVGGTVAKFESGAGGILCGLGALTGLITCTSDERLKKDITPLSSTYDAVMKLNPVSFKWNIDDSTAPLRYGFIAQEVEKIFPQLITVDSETGYKTLSINGMMPFVIKAFQEQSQSLTAKINSLFEKPIFGTREKPTGITIYDQVTGDPYCAGMRAGSWTSTPGECGTYVPPVQGPVVDEVVVEVAPSEPVEPAPEPLPAVEEVTE